MPTYTFAADKPTKGSGMGRLGRSRNKKGGNTITSSISKLDSHFQKSSLNQKVSDTQSLSYSASSSVAGKSRGSGASSDSSFADVMRVLEKNDAGEIAALMKREGVTDQTADEYVRNFHARKALAAGSSRRHGGGVSVSADSLAYSVDGDRSAGGGDSLAYSVDGESTINEENGAAAMYGSRYGGGMQSGQTSYEPVSKFQPNIGLDGVTNLKSPAHLRPWNKQSPSRDPPGMGGGASPETRQPNSPPDRHDPDAEYFGRHEDDDNWPPTSWWTCGNFSDTLTGICGRR